MRNVTLEKTDKLLLALLSSKVSEFLDLNKESLSHSEWDAIVESSQYHAVEPQLYKNLKDFWHDKIKIPKDIMQQLHDIYLLNSAMSLHRFVELANVLKILNENSIPVVVLKGACLASTIYKAEGLRTMSDVDLLFKEQDLASAQKLLQSKGYPAHSDKLNIDFHWTIDIPLHSAGISMEAIWGRVLTVKIWEKTAAILSPEDLIMHLVMHMSYQHLFRHAGVRSLLDIREVIEHYGDRLNWNDIQSRAYEWGMEKSALLTFYLAKELVDAKVPEDYLKLFSTDKDNFEVISWAMTLMFDRTPPSCSRISPQFSLLWSEKSMANKVKYLFRLLFPATREMSTTFPVVHGSSKNYLYYFVRLKKYFYYYCHLAWLAFRGDKETMQAIEDENKNIAIREWLRSNSSI